MSLAETITENHAVCRDFINQLKDRWLSTEIEILLIIDGGNVIYKGIKEVMVYKAVIQHCQWHKRENVVGYLDEKKKMEAVNRELRLINASAVKSLEEGLEETLTLHRLGLYAKLGESFKTTRIALRTSISPLALIPTE